jgi:fructose-specific phosphotransferase system IIC component
MEVLPEIKYLTFAIAIIFVMGHFLSWKVGGLKYWIARQNSIIWGVIIGSMLTLALFLRPAETVDFIYFRF